jgi:mRNA-degrading endonuclease RelE of RelBE toxin-antitoxin system
MRVEWTFTALSYLDQLSQSERAKITHTVDRLSSNWDPLDEDGPKQLTGDLGNLYSVRAGSDLSVLMTRENEHISVVDIVRRSQIEGLRRAAKVALAASG